MNPSSRRSFLKHSLLVAGSSVLLPRLTSLARALPREAEGTDEEICRRKFDLAVSQSLRGKPMSDVMTAVGTSFLGTPYLAYALEVPGEERLVVNLRGLDCVSFTENTLALSRCIKLGQHSFEEYQRQLRFIRYRNGVIDKYPSRLHYFSDWIDDNVRKKVVRNVTKENGGRPYRKTINYMSMHRSSYRQLSDDTFLAHIATTEKHLTERSHYYIPKGQLASVQAGIQNGDVIAITTSMEGMDIAHTGLAIRVDGVLKFLHAPLSGSSVQITHKSLVDYLQVYKKHTGIMVARPLEPAA